jgi:hypothetical protein
MGQIRKTPSGSFRACWRDPTGRQCSKTFPTRREASAHLAATESAMVDGSYVAPAAGRMLLREFAERGQSRVARVLAVGSGRRRSCRGTFFRSGVTGLFGRSITCQCSVG